VFMLEKHSHQQKFDKTLIHLKEDMHYTKYKNEESLR
jgi:hypothetical protein